MLARGEIHLPREHVGQVVCFADGSAGRVYRETRVDRSVSRPCVLVVSFRLRGVHGPAHALFRAESLLNTPLFVGFPGFVSKLWLSHDQRETYRGLYEWDGPALAETYARSLWRVLELVSVRGSIGYHVLPGCGRDDVLGDAVDLEGSGPREEEAWWRVVSVA